MICCCFCVVVFDCCGRHTFRVYASLGAQAAQDNAAGLVACGILDEDMKPRHQMPEQHRNRRRRGRRILLDGSQQIRSPISGPLIRRDLECRGKTSRSIRIISPQRADLLWIGIPRHIPRKRRAVVGQKGIGDIRRRLPIDPKTEPIPRLEVQRRCSNLIPRYDPNQTPAPCFRSGR